MSWRLFLVFLIPVAAGVWLDSGGDGTTFTMLGILLGTLSSVLVIKKVVSETTAQGGKHE